MPIGAPPRQIPTRKVGLKPLRTTCRPSSIESRNSESAEMKILSKGPIDIVVLRAQGIGYAHRGSYDSHLALVLRIPGKLGEARRSGSCFTGRTSLRAKPPSDEQSPCRAAAPLVDGRRRIVAQSIQQPLGIGVREQ